jgi:hypothetical protein
MKAGAYFKQRGDTAVNVCITLGEYDFSLYGMGEFRGVRKNARTIT